MEGHPSMARAPVNDQGGARWLHQIFSTTEFGPKFYPKKVVPSILRFLNIKSAMTGHVGRFLAEMLYFTGQTGKNFVPSGLWFFLPWGTPFYNALSTSDH